MICLDRRTLSHALAALAAWAAAIAFSDAQAAEPVYWRQRIFFIPYQPAANAGLPGKVDKVQLLVSRGNAGAWAVLQEAEPHVRGFTYHAPTDGQYDFALRLSDRKGNLSPQVIAQPQLRVIVDTQVPAIELSAALDATGSVVVRYEGRDLQVKPESLRLEVQADGKTWQRVGTGPPDVSQPDRLVGQVAWKPPTATGSLRFRAALEDRAGNQAGAVAEASLVGPLLGPAAGLLLGSASSLTPPGIASSANASNGAASTAAPRPIDWTVNRPQAGEANSPPPFQNPYTARPETTAATDPFNPFQNRTPAKLVADGNQPSPAQLPTTAATADSSAPSISPLPPVSAPASTTEPFGPPPLLNTPSPATPAAGAGQDWDSAAPRSPLTSSSPTTAPPTAAAPTDASIRWVNSVTFDVEYDLQTVGPWGVAKVELWATRDGGQSWASFGADPDNRGPMRVTVPAAGVFGFRLVVDGANGQAAPTPRPGEQPELVIGVDLEAPRTELHAAELGTGPLADHMLIRWTAADENLNARPVGLFFSNQPEGPWSLIATDLENNGQYAWRLLRQVPEQLFLRVEVRDRAGNVAVKQSPAPVVLNLPQPTGRFRNVRPVEGENDPNRYRTASGVRQLAPGQ